jgi:UDP-2,4-diacetamido-2,4,6-trideoxy-beta-L-altropyranose hydrolase
LDTIINSQLSLRKISPNDEEMLLRWANDPVVRSGSFSRSNISRKEHHSWFSNKLNDLNMLMFIFEFDMCPSGLVRFEKDNNNEVIISYQLAQSARGKKLASKMLNLAIKEVVKLWKIDKILAFTLPDNIASIKSLEKAGFYLIRSDNDKKVFEYKS